MRSRGRSSLSEILGLLLVTNLAAAAQATGSPKSESATVSVCLAKTINCVAPILPQQCLKGPTGAIGSETRGQESRTSTRDGRDSFATDTETPKRLQTNLILSFEEWKELMLRQHGQDPTDLQERQRTHAPPKTSETFDSILDTLDDDGEISLNFDISTDASHGSADSAANTIDSPDDALYDLGKAQYSRSKDAGKTCKERFSYSSFDAGATVLKASPGAQNPKAILLENKDSYMLFECTSEEKYIIVELSDDILIDTIVLANFEFFSSMVRHFQVSVSDRYPAKSEKWRQLGLFEGKNARDIQPFLVDNPQIWAKYVRLDFLTYYGNEYYCPLSLLRVHGTRMLESWKESEGAPEDEDSDHEVGSKGYIEAAIHEEELTSVVDSPRGLSSPRDGFFFFGIPRGICPAPIVTVEDILGPESGDWDLGGEPQRRGTSDTAKLARTQPHQAGPSVVPYTSSIVDTAEPTMTSAMPTSSPGRNAKKKSDRVIDTPIDATRQLSSSVGAPVQSRVAEPVSSQPRNRTSTSSGHATLPTVQESFFKTVSKRLQLLESNMTWTLKYVEDQSRHIQEALVRIEERRLNEAEALLGSLNHTVHVELSTLRQQYDHVWQSTVIALETQREQSQSELVALSSRLNVLADEAVFQKRMSIGQSILLLCCLVLIIFSRSVTHPIPLANWQPGPGSPFPSRPASPPGDLPTTATRPSPSNPGVSQPSAYGRNDECDHRDLACPEVGCDSRHQGERASENKHQGVLHNPTPYGTPEGTVYGGDDPGPLSSPDFMLGHDGAENDHSKLTDSAGRGHAKKPLPPLPE